MLLNILRFKSLDKYLNTSTSWVLAYIMREVLCLKICGMKKFGQNSWQPLSYLLLTINLHIIELLTF